MIEFEALAQLNVTQCNCSICSKYGYLHLIVPEDRFGLVKGSDFLITYEFNTKTAKHLFCKICGVKSFYVPHSYPNGYSVSSRCLEKDRIYSMHISESNGKDWEKLYPEG
jgi:hypothetical protein